MDIISRSKAQALGLKRYFNGKQCKWGHLAERYTYNKACLGCLKHISDEAKAATEMRRKAASPTARQIAQASGASTYFTGKPCPSGHVALRMTASRACVECQKEYVRNNKDHGNRYAAEWRARNIEKVAAALKRYRENNGPLLRKRSRSAYEKDVDKNRLRTKRWREKNPEGVRAHAMTRLVRKRGVSGAYTAGDVQALMAFQNGKCINCRCGIRKLFHVDHVMPLSKGGENNRLNIQLLCVKCNLRKHAKDPIDWAQENGRLL